MDNETAILLLNEIHQTAEANAEMVMKYYEKGQQNGTGQISEHELFQLMHSTINKMTIIHQRVVALLDENYPERSYVYSFANGRTDLEELLEVVEASPHRLAARNARWLKQRTKTPLPPSEG
jgi:hypothetical protein